MPNLTTPFLNLKGQDINEDMKKINEWSVSLIDELKTILCNLDSGNVTEAGSVKAQNIDVAQARIKGAQIQSLTADKLTAGTIDTGEITISNEEEKNGTKGRIEIANQQIVFTEDSVDRIIIGRTYTLNEDGEKVWHYTFTVQNSDGTQGIYMDEDGNINITGAIQTDKDCRIQGALRVGLRGSMKGIEFYGDAYSPDNEGNYSTPYAKILPVVDNEGNPLGISVIGGKLCIGSNSVPVATIEDINKLSARIEEVNDRLQSHLDSVQ